MVSWKEEDFNMELTLSKWDLQDLAEKIAQEDCDSSVSIPIYEVEECEFQVVCHFKLAVHYGEREENTGWRNVDTVDFCVTDMYVGCDGEPISSVSVDWDDALLYHYVREHYD